MYTFYKWNKNVMYVMNYVIPLLNAIVKPYLYINLALQ